MTVRAQISEILKKINVENLDKGMEVFNKAIQDFGDSMDSITRELSSDIEKSNNESKIREQRNKENLDKIWGTKD